MQNQLKILCLDIENFPCLVYSWGLGEQIIPLDFLVRDWNICAWSAKWYGQDEVFYMDNRDQRNIYGDERLVKGLIKLINQADVILGQNVRKFDLRKIAARAEFYKLSPFRPCKVIDILTEERKVFAFTSHKLAYKTDRNEKYQKLEHSAYPGFDLWKGCMGDLKVKCAQGELKAWKEMEVYCKHDVLSTEERYQNVRGWIKIPTLGPIDDNVRCLCGSTNLMQRGYSETLVGRYHSYRCRDCGKWPRGTKNLLTKEQREVRLREVKR